MVTSRSVTMDGLITRSDCFVSRMLLLIRRKTSKKDSIVCYLSTAMCLITTAAIQYAITNKIIVLCLPPYTTHLLQPLDVGIFAPLTSAYKRGVHSITRYGARYHIDKEDFLDLYKNARNEAISPINVQKAWTKAGLHSFNPDVILQHFKKDLPVPRDVPRDQIQSFNMTVRLTTPPETTLT